MSPFMKIAPFDKYISKPKDQLNNLMDPRSTENTEESHNVKQQIAGWDDRKNC